VLVRKHITQIALAGAAVLLLASCGDDTPDTAATVNGTDIATSEVAAQAAIIGMNPQVTQQFEGASDEQVEQQLNAYALSQLIYERILLDGADELGVAVTDEGIDETAAELSTQFGGEEEMYAQLEEQGLDRAEVDRQIGLIATQEAVTAELGQDVSDAQVEEAYETGTPARHVLVETEEEAIDVYERIDGGEDFAAVAEETSIDGTGQEGGELGFVQPGMTVPEFEEALFGADEGELVGPVQSDFGFHVIERLEKPALEDVAEEIRANLEQQASQEDQMAFQQFITERMSSADIQVDPAFGTWDAETGQVVPPDPIQPDQPEQPLPEQPEQPENGGDEEGTPDE
jgi:foldase protein PrsA